MTYLLPNDWLRLSTEAIASLAPVQRLHWSTAQNAGVEIVVKREDLLHPYLGGNKFYKLILHLNRWQQSADVPLLTFGGAYSNHICAVAAVGYQLQRPTIGVIRGEMPRALSVTLKRAMRHGMHLHFVSREAYRNKMTEAFIATLHKRFGAFYLVPEGGADDLGVLGCQQWVRTAVAMSPWEPTQLWLASGTGGTLAGALSAVCRPISVHGVLALKGTASELDDFKANVLTLAQASVPISERFNALFPLWSLETDYHCGGYAKNPAALKEFIAQFEAETGLPLDHVYTAKLFWALADYLQKGLIPANEKLLILHTGGMQSVCESVDN